MALLALTKRRTASIKVNLQHWWWFEEARGVAKTDTANGNNLSLLTFGGSAPENLVTGLVNNANQLPFQSKFQGISPVDLHSGDFTVVGVFNAPLDRSGVISQSAPKETQSQWWINTFDGNLVAGWSTDGTRGAGAHFLSNPTHIANNTTHTYMFWRDTATNTFNLVVDGDGSGTVATASFSGSTALFSPVTSGIIVGGIGTDLFISGLNLVDETGIWTRVLTQAERTFIYNGGAWRTYTDF